MTDPKHDRIMAAARSLAVDFAIRIDGMSVDEANAYFKIGDQAARVSQTITDALALAAAEGLSRGNCEQWRFNEADDVLLCDGGDEADPDSEVLRYRCDVCGAKAEVERLRAKLEVT